MMHDFQSTVKSGDSSIKDRRLRIGITATLEEQLFQTEHVTEIGKVKSQEPRLKYWQRNVNGMTRTISLQDWPWTPEETEEAVKAIGERVRMPMEVSTQAQLLRVTVKREDFIEHATRIAAKYAPPSPPSSIGTYAGR